MIPPQGRVLYIANIPKNMNIVMPADKNFLSFSAPWSPDGQSAPTMQGVMFTLPKGKNVVFKADIEKAQAAM
jgi:hypothetical protein